MPQGSLATSNASAYTTRTVPTGPPLPIASPYSPIPCRPHTEDMLSGPLAPSNSGKGSEMVTARPPVLTPGSMKKKKKGKRPDPSQARAMPAGPLNSQYAWHSCQVDLLHEAEEGKCNGALQQK